jgi:hypothetical protein
MRRVTFLMVVACFVAFVATPPARQAVGQAPAPAPTAPGADLAGKVVLVNYRLSSGPQHAVLQSPVTRRLGTRDYLTGDLVFPEDAPGVADWRGAAFWVPIDTVESLTVFADKDKALRIGGAVVAPAGPGGSTDKK